MIHTFIFINSKENMTRLGLYFYKKSVNKAEVSKRTGISQARLSQLSLKENTKLRAEELYLIALAIDVDPCDIFKELYKDLNLLKEEE